MVYTGKPKRLPSPYYICGTENYIKQLVSTVDDRLCLQRRNVPTDRLYISYHLGQWLLDKKLINVHWHNAEQLCRHPGGVEGNQRQESPQPKDGLGEAQERDGPDIIRR